MEPGLRDREYDAVEQLLSEALDWLQWSPVLETGNTPSPPGRLMPPSTCCNGARS